MSRLSKTLFMAYIGFTTYISLEVCYRNVSFPLMGVLGAIAFLVLDQLNDRISWDMDILLQGCIGSVLITGMEFIIGNLSLAGVLPKMWDYSNVWLNYKGIICLPFSLIWIVLSICAIMLADAINYYIFDEQPIPYYRLFGKVIIKFKEKKSNKE